MAQKTALSSEDLAFIQRTGRDLQTVESQLTRFQTGFPPLKLVRPILAGDGMRQLDSQRQEDLFLTFEVQAKQTRGYKFVPASGAASRMFRSLFGWLQHKENSPEKVQKEVEAFMQGLPQFAFYAQLAQSLLADGEDVQTLLEEKDYAPILTHLLGADKLAFGNLPKGLIPFHEAEEKVRTALEEHALEAALYGVSEGATARIHITVSPEHQEAIETRLKSAFAEWEDRYGISFWLETSVQQPQTDTPAVTPDNELFRLENGEVLFRPGGHGALLENLNEIEADWVFIKNVDNVVPAFRVTPTVHWKKVMGGLLFETQKKVFAALNKLDKLDEAGRSVYEPELRALLVEELHVGLPTEYEEWTMEAKVSHLRRMLDRPIRVLGCIRTDENTGGGPFWVEAVDGSLSLQVVETAQINLDDSEQAAITTQSGYANITFLVCGLKTYQGKSFDLRDFRDEQTGFITEKSLNGRPLKALELPGLWNGAMADWISLFVEVPKEVFNPVKSVVDLLAPMHQG